MKISMKTAHKPTAKQPTRTELLAEIGLLNARLTDLNSNHKRILEDYNLMREDNLLLRDDRKKNMLKLDSTEIALATTLTQRDEVVRQRDEAKEHLKAAREINRMLADLGDKARRDLAPAVKPPEPKKVYNACAPAEVLRSIPIEEVRTMRDMDRVSS